MKYGWYYNALHLRAARFIRLMECSVIKSNSDTLKKWTCKNRSWISTLNTPPHRMIVQCPGMISLRLRGILFKRLFEKMFIMKLHKILLHLQRKLQHMFCSTYYSTRILLKKEEMCWLITSNGLSVAISTYFIVMFRQESDNNSLQLSQKPSLSKSSW